MNGMQPSNSTFFKLQAHSNEFSLHHCPLCSYLLAEIYMAAIMIYIRKRERSCTDRLEFIPKNLQQQLFPAIPILSSQNILL